MDSEESDDSDGLEGVFEGCAVDSNVEGVFEGCAVEVGSGRDDADVGRRDVGRRGVGRRDVVDGRGMGDDGSALVWSL